MRWLNRYMVAGGKDGEHLAVATTRPETILGDTAVCVHPEVRHKKHASSASYMSSTPQ